MSATAWAERGLVPDAVLRAGIRGQLRERLRVERRGGCEQRAAALDRFVQELRGSEIAVETDAANRQHYELPPEFFRAVLGPHLKYSSGLWPDGVDGLPAAEEAMLQLTCERAGIEDGMHVLDLGCGWGSLALWIAERFPRCRVLAVSNSKPQREFVEARAGERGLSNIQAQRADMREFETERRFDRVVSVEMFEHMRNYERLLGRIGSWLDPGGRLFVHVFCHRELAYPYEVDGRNDWMARHFFTGGLMPSADLLLHFQRDLLLERRWSVDGRHYSKTLEAWLVRMDGQRTTLLPLFESTYGNEAAPVWWQRWRMFFLACSELFGYRDGGEWHVAHYLFAPRAAGS